MSLIGFTCGLCGERTVHNEIPAACPYCQKVNTMQSEQFVKRYKCAECGYRTNLNSPSQSCPVCCVSGVMVDRQSELPLQIGNVDPASAVIRMNPWINETDPKVIRRIGKLGEEVAELAKVLFRIQIQGINGVDPASGKTNLQSLMEELADVSVQSDLTIEHFGFNTAAMVERMDRKRANMREWEEIAPYA